MSAYLLDVDNGNEKIAMNKEEITIGRGPFLKITDKRVSRNHAVLRYKDGKLALNPVHKNPTFYRPSASPKYKPLDKDIWQDLSNGDTISLLPNELVFTVMLDCKEDSVCSLPLDVDIHKQIQIDVGDQPASIIGKCRSKDESTIPDQANQHTDNNTLYSVKKIITSPVKKRTLPSWMINTHKKEKVQKNVGKDALKSELKVFYGNNREELKESVCTVTKKNESSNMKQSATPVCSEEKEEIGEGEHSLAAHIEETKMKQACPYGSQCYRKNLAHFKEFSHSDVTIVEIDETNEPECEYGTSCYRKNPLHLQQYNHTKNTNTNSTTLRTRPKRKGRSGLDNESDDDSEKNSYDYEDSFNDDEEVTASSQSYEDDDDDSDYKPQTNELEDEEDVKELLNEPDDFIRGK